MTAPRFLLKFRLEKKPNRDREDVTIERARVLVGSRPLADVHIPDRLVPQEAAELVFDGRRLEIEVRGRISGVYVDGVPGEGSGPVQHGSTIHVGSCMIEVAIDGAAALCTLTVGERHLHAAVAAAAKKADAPFALEDDGPQEQRWGRNRVLTTWNWVAAFAGLLLVAAFPFATGTAVTDRGELTRAHAPGAKGAPEGCASCHEPFASDYDARCTKCHEGFASQQHHPFGRASDFTCAHCHAEHRGADADPLPPMTVGASGWPRTCEECHAGRDRDEMAKAAAAHADPARVRDRTAEPVSRVLLIDGFSHADHRVAKPRRASLAGGAKAPEGDVPVPCAKCHARGDGAGAAEFAPVSYEKCLECHAEWRVDVHGRDDGGVHCFQCHARTDDLARITKDIRTAVVPATGSLYELVPRRHDTAKDDCRSCHVTDRTAPPAAQRTVRRAFRHDHHLRTVAPERGGALALAVTCVPCHGDVAESASLAGLGGALAPAKLDGCRECHTEGAPQPVPASGTRTVTDMFHAVHTVEPGTSGGALRALANRETLSNGCLSCHVPVAGEGPMGLREGTKDCTACHAGHESLGGGRCALCHTDRRDPANRDAKGGLLYRRNEPGVFDPSKGVVRTTAPVARFDHFSRGHLGTPGAVPDCAECHDVSGTDRAERVSDVAWPGPFEASCARCHARERYHR